MTAFSSCPQVRIDKDFPEPRLLARGALVLERGGLIAYPTDTSYGLGCAMNQALAIERLVKLKNLKPDHLFSLICPDLSDIARYAVLENNAYRIIKNHLPGPYTFILRATPLVPQIFRSERQTIGIRVPDCQVTLMLSRILRMPLVSTSAKKDERILINGAEINQVFGAGLDLILDVGQINPIHSSVVDLSGPYPQVVRQGAGDLKKIMV